VNRFHDSAGVGRDDRDFAEVVQHAGAPQQGVERRLLM
jgi:hypothetical protein